jgi:hypothetical protein
MKVKLNLKDRFIIGELLPQKANRLTMVIARDILNKIDITQNDIEEYGITIEGNGYKWNPEKGVIEKEYDFTEAEINVLIEGINELDKSNGITLDMINTVEKIFHLNLNCTF